MKKSALIPVFLFILLGSFLSCKKNNERSPVLWAVKKNTVLQHDFGKMGYEDDFRITRNPSHFLINSLELDNSNNVIYSYKPTLDFVGTDHVELTRYRSAGGPFFDSVKYDILLKVTE